MIERQDQTASLLALENAVVISLLDEESPGSHQDQLESLGQETEEMKIKRNGLSKSVGKCYVSVPPFPSLRLFYKPTWETKTVEYAIYLHRSTSGE